MIKFIQQILYNGNKFKNYGVEKNNKTFLFLH